MKDEDHTLDPERGMPDYAHGTELQNITMAEKIDKLLEIKY